MALELYKVEYTYTKLNYPNPLTFRELDFLDEFQTDDGKCLLNRERLDAMVEDYAEDNLDIPEELVAFLSEYLTNEGDVCLHIE